MHCDIMLPAKIIPATHSAYVCKLINKLSIFYTVNLKILFSLNYAAYNGTEIPVHNYEVLTGKARIFRWIPASDGKFN